MLSKKVRKAIKKRLLAELVVSSHGNADEIKKLTDALSIASNPY